MNNFLKIVRNYEYAYKLGKDIINHRDIIIKTAPTKLDEEFKKQEERIQEFFRITKKSEQEWKKNKYSINEYWTGLS